MIFGPTGNVGVPFVGPDFGERMVRVTDSNTETLRFGCCQTNSSAEAREWSAFNPNMFFGDGGENFYTQDNGGAFLVFGIDAKTMAICQYTYAPNVSSCNPSGNPHGLASGRNNTSNWNIHTWGDASPTVAYGSGGSLTVTQFSKYDFSTDLFYGGSGVTHNAPVSFVDLSSCPNFPTIVGNVGSSYNVRGDRYFSAVFGGQAQNYYIAGWEDLQTGNCYWYDTAHGQYGGTGYSGVQTTTFGMLPTPGPISISTDAGGSVNYCAVVTAITTSAAAGTQSGNGETAPTAEVCQTASSTANITVTFTGPGAFSDPYQVNIPGCAANTFSDVSPCRPYNVYIGSGGPGSEHLQTTASVSYGSGTYTIAATSLVTGTVTPPTSSNAGLIIHQGQPNTSGTLFNLACSGGCSSYRFWTPPATFMFCPSYVGSNNASCSSGHAVGGTTNWLENNGFPGGSFNQYSISERPFSNPFQLPSIPYSIVATNQVPPGTPPAFDMHLSWNDNNPFDTVPVGVLNYRSVVTGNGLVDLNSNPCTSNGGSGWINEILNYATDGSGKVWRFAHHRGGICKNPNDTENAAFTGQIPIGNVSENGRFYLFHSTYGWGLGNSLQGVSNNTAYPSSTWQSGHVYASHAFIWDGANFEINEGSQFTSGSTQPTWLTSSGGTVSDNGGTWTMVTGCADQNNPSYGVQCRTDVFVVETK